MRYAIKKKKKKALIKIRFHSSIAEFKLILHTVLLGLEAKWEQKGSV